VDLRPHCEKNRTSSGSLRRRRSLLKCTQTAPRPTDHLQGSGFLSIELNRHAVVSWELLRKPAPALPIGWRLPTALPKPPSLAQLFNPPIESKAKAVSSRGLVTAKPTAFGRVTRRASSDPACFPHSGQGLGKTLARPWISLDVVLNREAFAGNWEKPWTAPTPRPQRGQPLVVGPLGGPS
jgi:hypothetical protein